MGSKIQEDIKQSKPFETLEQEVYVNLARTAAVLTHRLEQEFKPFGLTVTQYNVLRIVRGAGASGIAQYDVANRMVAEIPDVPRLLKRLEESKLIRRSQDAKDRRVLTVFLTPAGAKLLREMDDFIRKINNSFFSRLSKAQLQTLNNLLNESR